jgi:hypothetical protein
MYYDKLELKMVIYSQILKKYHVKYQKFNLTISSLIYLNKNIIIYLNTLI